MVEPTTHGSRGPAGSGGVAESLAFWQAVLETASAQLLVEQAAREAASRRSARLRALHEAALTMNTVVESEPGAIVSLLAEILRRAVAALDGRDGRIVLTEDPAWRDLTPGHVPAEGLILLDHMAQLRRAPFRADGATEHVLRTGELVHIRDVLEGGRFGPYPQLARHDIRSLVIVPLRISGRVIGSFSVTFGRTHDLLPEDREAVELFAGHAAGAVERARLLHAEQRRAGQAERLAATLARVGAAPDLLQALEALLRGAISLLGGADGIARLFGPEIGDRPLELNIGEDGRLISRVNAPRLPPESLSARLQADGQPILMEDYWVLDPDTFPHYQTMKRLGMRSAVFVPIDGSSGRIGGLSVNHPLPGYFGPADLALAGALAAQAGAAIERARLDAARQAAIRSREEALDALSRQTEALARREAEAVALRELDEMKNEFLTTISHELRTPLTVVHGYAQHLLESARHFSAAEVERVAGQMYANSRQLVRMMQDLVEFARLGRGGAVVQPDMYDIVPQLTELVDAFRQQAGGEHVSLEVPASLTVYADSACVGQVVSNLLDNAIKYAPQG
ncbi:MAG: GAF domain-containing protein, partial [Chloroflexota bacterium]|nr:GAF domain-containing protein [Chloroflexota bacterium]